jgi:regulator of cell morphogenesis and NO signaling
MSCLTLHQPAPEPTVGQLVVERPARARVFERLGIDYCCGGRKSLALACREKDLDPDAVLRELDAEAEAPPADETDWSAATLAELADHIEQTHHAFLKAELPRLDRLTRKVAAVHGQRHPELVGLRLVYAHLMRELESHLLDEEAVVFPLCRRLDPSGTGGPPRDPAGRSVQSPIAALTHEHDDAGAALAEMRRLAADYVPPEGACNTYRAMLAGLAELEADMHRHVHKENNILFPRAVEAEAGRSRRKRS